MIPRSRGNRAGGSLHSVGVAVAALEHVGLASVAIGVPVPPEEHGVGVVYVVGENATVSGIVGAEGVELGPSRNGQGGNLAVRALEFSVGLHATRGIEVDALAELGVDPVGTAAARPRGVVVLAAEIARLVAGTFVQGPVGAEILVARNAHAGVGLERSDFGYLNPDAGSAPGVPFVHLVGQESTARRIGEAEVATVRRGYLRILEARSGRFAQLVVGGKFVEIVVTRVGQGDGHGVEPLVEVNHVQGDFLHGCRIGGESGHLEGIAADGGGGAREHTGSLIYAEPRGFTVGIEADGTVGCLDLIAERLVQACRHDGGGSDVGGDVDYAVTEDVGGFLIRIAWQRPRRTAVGVVTESGRFLGASGSASSVGHA